MKRLSISPFVLMFTLSTTILAMSSSSFGFSHQQSHQQQQQQQLFSHQPQQELVPSANIFTPAWLAQRRSRYLGNSGSSPSIYALYQQPQQQQQFSYQQHYQPQTTSSHYLATPNLSRGSPLPLFHMVPPSPPQPQPQLQQQYYQPNFDSMPHHGRFSPVYYHPPTNSAGTTFYLAPVVHVPAPTGDQGDHHHHHHQISKRVDHHQQFLKPLSSEHVKHAKPCSGSSSSSSIPLPSEQYPVYVLPPKNFQPIIYHHTQQQQQAYHPPQGVTKTAEELWYESNDNAGKVKYGNGGKHGTTEGNSLESSSRPSPSNEFRKIYLVPVTADQVGGQNSFPVYEAVIREVATAVDAKPVPVTNAFNSQIERLPHPQQQQQQQQLSNDQPEKVGVDQRRPLKTKLPVGLTSFFLGGVRGVSGRHWAMPPALVKDLEFMPNGSPMSPENKYLPEESYVKKVDNGGGSGDSSVASAGDPEKEDSVVAASASAGNKSRNQVTGGNKKKGIFESGNTIIDSPLDLETAESSSSFSSSAKQVISVVPSSSTSIAKS